MTSLYLARVDLEAEVSALLAMLGDEEAADEALDLAAPWAACLAAMATWEAEMAKVRCTLSFFLRREARPSQYDN